MTDFVQFLYTQYIQSYIDAMPMDAADEYHHDLVKNECTGAGLAAHGRM